MRAVTVIVRLALAAALLGATGTTAAAQDSDEDGQLQLVLTAISPQVAQPGDTLQIEGYVQNTSDVPLDEVAVDIDVRADPFDGRNQLQAFADGRSGSFLRQLEASAGIHAVAAGESAPFRLTVPVDDLGLPPEDDVYGLRVTATGDSAAADDVYTFLPWFPDADAAQPVQVAWLWPLVDEPVRDEAGVFSDDHLAGSLAPGGRLAELTRAADGRPVTWVVDPDLLETAAAMTDGYRVSDDTGEGDSAAASWLGELSAAAGSEDAEVIALPYADVDVAGLAHSDRTEILAQATDRGVDVAASHLGRTPAAGVAWPAADVADTTTLDALAAAGFTGVILDDAAAPPTPTDYTPTGRTDLDTGTLAGLLADERLAALLAEDSRQPGAGTLIVQRMLAETAYIALERPNRQRAVLVEPPRRWDPDPGTATALLTGYASAPWIEPITATELLAIEAPAGDHGDPVSPEDARLAELPADHLAAVADLGHRVAEFATVLSEPADLVNSYSAALLRALSTAWADGDGGISERGAQYLQSLQRGLGDQIDQLRIISRGTVTLSSNAGTIPVTIANDLDQAVQLSLALTPRVASRLRIDQPPAFAVDAGKTRTVEVQASAVANGLTTVTVQLQTVAGDPLGAATEFNVRATDFGRVGFYIIGGAIVLLFVSAGVRIARRIVAGRRRRPAHAHAETSRQREKV